MMTNKVLYKHMKNWTEKPKGSRPVIQHIWFDGERAVATNNHTMAIAKDIHTGNPYFETVEGKNVGIPENWEFPDPDYVMIKENDVYGKIPLTPDKVMLQSWCMMGNLVKKISKGESAPFCYLTNNHGNLEIYSTGNGLKTYMSLARTKKESADRWGAYFNAEYIANAFEFIKDTAPQHIEIYTNKLKSILAFETNDLLLLICKCKIADDRPLAKWIKSQEELGAPVQEQASDFDFDM